MAADPKLCGQQVVFHVPPNAPRARSPRFDWVYALLVIAAVAAVVHSRVYFIPWVLAFFCRRPRAVSASAPHRSIRLGRRALHLDGRVHQLGSSAIWIERAEVLVISRRRERAVRVDLRAMDLARRHELALRLEARQKLARRARVPNDHAIALEAFYVFGAAAVRVRGHVVREVFARGPWTVSDPRDTIYVRELPSTAGDPYRSPFPNVVAIGAL
jgi:hypothetical protein